MTGYPASTKEPPETTLRGSFQRALADPERFTAAFYERLFQLAPSVRSLFPEQIRDQEYKLARTLITLLRGLDEPEALEPALRSLGARHLAYGVEPRHYAVVGEALIDTVERHQGALLEPGLRQQWQRLYGWIAATMLAGAVATVEF